MAEKNVYDVIIVGAGPAGLAAGVYTGRDRYSTLMLDKGVPGGQINLTDRIENYPGYMKIGGPELVAVMREQCETFGVEFEEGAEATSLTREDDGTLVVNVNEEQDYRARSIILTPGSDYRQLGVPGEQEFRSAGSGVSYCGTCDAPFFKDKVVVSVGAGNTGVEEALHLGKFCKKVYLVHRRQEFRAQQILVEELMSKKDELNIELVLDTVVESIGGQGKVEHVVTRNVKTDEKGQLDCEGVFIFVGMIPNTDWLKGSITLDDNGFIVCDTAYLRTNMQGVFVAGDCRVAAALQLATSCGDGVLAAMGIKQYLKDPDWWFHAAPGLQPER